MNSSVLLLLTSAFLHASWNAIAKSSKDKETFLFLAMTVSNIVACIAVLHQGAFHIGDNVSSAILSGLFEGAYFVTLGKALRQSDLGKSYSIMRGGAMLIVWLISIFFFQESATLIQGLGAILVFIGILFLNGFSFGRPQGNTGGKSYWSWICAVCIGGYHLCYHRALQGQADPKSLFALAMMISWPFLILAIGGNYLPRMKEVLRKHSWRVVITGIAAFLSFVIFLYGLKASGPGFAISLRNSSIFFAIVLSYFLRESLTRPQILGALTVGVGALLLSLP